MDRCRGRDNNKAGGADRSPHGRRQRNMRGRILGARRAQGKVWLDGGELEQLRRIPEAAFGRFTPQKVEELKMKKEIDREHWVLLTAGLHLRGRRRPCGR